jgi:nucleoside-diphosphate-sugar epimerase
VDAFLRAGASDAVNGDVFNVGGSDHITHRELVQLLIEEAGQGSVKFVEWPEEKRRIDIGSFYSDSSKFQRTTGWAPSVGLRDGLRQTLAYYREHFDRYVDEMDKRPA